MTLTLLKAPASVLRESPNASESIAFLTKVLNNGYNAVKQKYKIIRSTRIKNEKVFIEDLGIHAEGSFILTLIQDPEQNKNDILSDLEASNVAEETAGNDLSFRDIDQSMILGTIAAKPKSLDGVEALGWEITGFTSFYKGVGQYLLRHLETVARTTKGVDFLFASVIFEHQLVPYYSKFGFKEIGERALLTIDENYKVKGSALEDGIYANQAFHVAFLAKHF